MHCHSGQQIGKVEQQASMTVCKHLTGCECGRLTCFISSLMSSFAGSNSSRMRSQRAANHPQTSMKSYVRCMWRSLLKKNALRYYSGYIIAHLGDSAGLAALVVTVVLMIVINSVFRSVHRKLSH